MGWPAGMPPPVLPEECSLLRSRTAAVARGEAVLLQGGGRAGLPLGRTEEALRRWIRTLLEMELPLAYATGLPVVKVGWTVGGRSGDRGLSSRAASEVYAAAVVALNLLRALAMDAPDPRTLSPVVDGSDRGLLAAVSRGLTLSDAYGLGRRPASARREIFVGSQTGPADYERALTITAAEPGTAWAASGHLQWLHPGPDAATDITRLAAVSNGLAVRIGAQTRPDTVLELVDALDPRREPGRLTLVVGMGADGVRDSLSVLIDKVRAEGATVCWLADPLCGGATPQAALAGVRAFVEIHRALGSHPGGVHVEPARPGPAGTRFLLDLACEFAQAC
ncbi:3-deoxy-7-phosphoheptulonate synthase [Catenulispora rubra]|uniref:3-deoxy-7-phosphoheptulonate synthase n=1 Tax=Catenulispora rubra TaxID=280293 RepID=UPI0018926CD3|nr:3-deoxy-7-phosphoheptulonate synthase [Catenulispora rubra]